MHEKKEKRQKIESAKIKCFVIRTYTFLKFNFWRVPSGRAVRSTWYFAPIAHAIIIKKSRLVHNKTGFTYI